MNIVRHINDNLEPKGNIIAEAQNKLLEGPEAQVRTIIGAWDERGITIKLRMQVLRSQIRMTRSKNNAKSVHRPRRN